MSKTNIGKEVTCPVLREGLEQQVKLLKSMTPNSEDILSETISVRQSFRELDVESLTIDFYSAHTRQLCTEFEIENMAEVEVISFLNMAAYLYLNQHLQSNLKAQLKEYNRYILKIEKQAAKLENLIYSEIEQLKAMMSLLNAYEDEKYFDKSIWQNTLDNLSELKLIRDKVKKHPISQFTHLNTQAPNNLPGLRNWIEIMLNFWTNTLSRSLAKTTPGRNGKTAFLEFCEFCIHVIHPEIEFHSLENALKYIQSKKRELPLKIENGSPSNI